MVKCSIENMDEEGEREGRRRGREGGEGVGGTTPHKPHTKDGTTPHKKEATPHIKWVRRGVGVGVDRC